MEYLIIFTVGLAGMFLHFVKRKLRKETEFNLWGYLVNNKAATMQALITLVTALFTLVSGLDIDISNMKDIATVFLAGYAADSAANKDKK